MSIEYGYILRIRFKTKEEELFFVDKISEEGFTLLSRDGKKQLLPFEDTDILEVSIVYIPPNPDYASINHLYVGNWVKVDFTDTPLFGKLIKTGSTLEIDSNGEMYYIPVRYGLPKDIKTITLSQPPMKRNTIKPMEGQKPEGVQQETEAEVEDIYDVEDNYDQLFYTMEQKKNDLTESLLQNLEKQSQRSLKIVFQEVQRFQELFEKYTSFEKNILLKRLPPNLYLESFLKNENLFFSPVSDHIKVKQHTPDILKRANRPPAPDYFFRYDEPLSTYEMYLNKDTVKYTPYDEFISKQAKVVNSYDIKKNHTEHDFYPTKNREVYLMNDLANYKVNESFVTDSLVLKPHTLQRYERQGASLLSKVRLSVPYFDMFFRKSSDDLINVVVHEGYKADDCAPMEKMVWFKNECPTFQTYIEKLFPSFQLFSDCYVEKDYLNFHQALYELEILHINEFNADIYKEVSDTIVKNVNLFVEEREKSKKQSLRRKPELFTKDNSELHMILQKDYGLGQRPEKTYYTTSELWKEGMFDQFHFYVIQYLKKHTLLQQVISNEELSRLVEEIKAAFGKETEEKIHKVYELEQQRENDQYKWVLQDVTRGKSFVSADEELYRKLIQDKNSALTLDEVTQKLNKIKDLGETEIVTEFGKELAPFIQDFLLKLKIMKGQVAFVKESGKKYRWSGEKWVDFSEDFQTKKLFKIKDCKDIYNEESFKKKVHEMITEFESEKLRNQAIQKMKLEDESHKMSLEKRKKMWLKENMKYHTEKYQYYELELQKELFEPKQSPYLHLRNRILQEMILENKFKAIQLFVQNYTKTGEDVHWYYCLETGTKLMPVFFMELADAFLKTNTYPETLQLICNRQGELSGNHDFYVDKYSGFPIKQIQFDDEEDFNDQGFRDIFHSVVEKEIEDVGGETQNPVRNALKAFLNLMGLVPDDEALEEVLINVEKSFLLASGDKKREREQNQIYIYAILSHSLIYGQTLQGNVRLSKPFPDCPKSLKGFPLNTTSKKGLEFVCCIVAKMPKTNEPWNSMSQIKVDKLMEMSELFIQKYVLTLQDIQEKISMKQEIQEKRESFPVWKLFYPRLTPIKVVPQLSNLLVDRTIALSFLLQQRIHDFVSTQTAVLVNQAQEPYLINTCCQTNNDVYDYFLENAKLAPILKDLQEVIKKQRRRDQTMLTNHMYSSMNTKNPVAAIPDSFDEKTIYRAIIKIFLLDTESEQPRKLQKYKVTKPAEYKKNDPFEKKFELLKQMSINEKTFVAMLRDNAKMFEPRKGRILTEVEKGDHPIDLILNDNKEMKEKAAEMKAPEMKAPEMKESRVKAKTKDTEKGTEKIQTVEKEKERSLYNFCMVEIEEKVKFLLSKANDRTERTDFQECFQFYKLFRSEKNNNFLPPGMEHKDTMNQILYNKIMDLLYVFPQKIYNKKYRSQKIPRHWNLDQMHKDNIIAFNRNYDKLVIFYENKTWMMKHSEIDIDNYKRWMKTPMTITMRYIVYCYIYVSFFHDLVSSGLIDYVKVIVQIFTDEDKFALNFDKKHIDYISDMRKKDETNRKTEDLKKLTKEARRAQNAMKDLKLGEWGVGLDKSLFKYDKAKYGDVLKEATLIAEGMDVPDEIYGTYGVDDGDNLEGFDGDEYYS